MLRQLKSTSIAFTCTWLFGWLCKSNSKSVELADAGRLNNEHGNREEKSIWDFFCLLFMKQAPRDDHS
jgi:hypothetical protein